MRHVGRVGLAAAAQRAAGIAALPLLHAHHFKGTRALHARICTGALGPGVRGVEWGSRCTVLLALQGRVLPFVCAQASVQHHAGQAVCDSTLLP